MALSTLSCAPTYPAAGLTQAIENVIRNDYQVNVTAWLMGGTVGVDVPTHVLFETPARMSEDASEALEGAVEGLGRVILSTDAKPDFLLIRAYDDLEDGNELVLIRYVYDMKQAYGMRISRGEYLKRSVLRRRVNPASLGERAVKSFIKEMEKGISIQTLNSYFGRDISRSMTPAFFLYLLESDYKQYLSYEIRDLKSVRIAPQAALVWVKLIENYELRKGSLESDLIYPSGFEHEWFFEIVSGVYPRVIQNIAVLNIREASGEVIRLPLPEVYARWEDISSWGEIPFHEEVELDDFVSAQAARRIENALGDEPTLKELLEVLDVGCVFMTLDPDEPLSDSTTFVIQIVTRGKGDELSEDGLVTVYKEAVGISEIVLKGYGYEDCKNIMVYLSGHDPYLISREEVKKFLKGK